MNEWPKVNCPKCNALQEFKPRFRKHKDQHLMDKYIRCAKCRSEWILTPVRDVELSKERRRARHKRNAAKG